jgi:large subunit ribosomal protein L25
MTTQITLVDREQNLNPRQIRSQGFIPVTVYGKSIEAPLSLKLSKHDFNKKHLQRAIQALEAEVPGKKTKLLVVIKAIESNPVTDEILNIQFHCVKPDDLVKVTVPIIYAGVSPLVQAGGVLKYNNRTVNLECPAKQIPDGVKFDLATLAGDKTIAFYGDLILEKGVLLKSEATQITVKVTIPTISAAKTDEKAK